MDKLTCIEYVYTHASSIVTCHMQYLIAYLEVLQWLVVWTAIAVKCHTLHASVLRQQTDEYLSQYHLHPGTLAHTSGICDDINNTVYNNSTQKHGHA